jgi:ribosomal-protein-serine acetyltransferase
MLTGQTLPNKIVNIHRFKEPRIIRKETVLTGDSVLLRPYVKSDAEELYKGVRESLVEMSPWLPFAHEDYSMKETREWLKKRASEWKKGLTYDFGMFDPKDGSFMGGCGLNHIDYESLSANLGYWVRTSRAGESIAPAATIMLAKWGFKELALNRIEIIVATGNERSQRAAEKAGACREGILRKRIVVGEKVYDAVMYSLIPRDL